LDEKDNSKLHLNAARSFYNSSKKNSYYRSIMAAYEADYAIRNGDYELAISHVQPAIGGSCVASRYYLAKAHDLKGNKNLAIKHYKETIRAMDPAFIGFFYNESKLRLTELIK